MPHTALMSTAASLYHRHRFPSEIISHSVWLYFRFSLLNELPRCRRNVSNARHLPSAMRLSENGVSSSVRLTPTDCVTGHLVLATDGISTKCSSKSTDDSITFGCSGSRWRVLDIRVQTKRDKTAAKKFFRKLLKGLRYLPRMIVTDKLMSYNAARTEVGPSVEHAHQKYQNNRAENSHQPTRLREKAMRGFKSSGHAQRFSRPSESLPHTSGWGDICTALALTEQG